MPIFEKKSELHPIEKLAEIGRVNPKVRSDVFMGHQLKQMRASPAKCFIAFFDGQGVQFYMAVDHPSQDKFSHSPEKPLQGLRPVKQF